MHKPISKNYLIEIRGTQKYKSDENRISKILIENNISITWVLEIKKKKILVYESLVTLIKLGL